MPTQSRQRRRIAPEWLALMLVLAICGGIALSVAAFNQTFTPAVPAPWTADRSGLVVEPNAKVKMRGVQVGHGATITGGTGAARLQLDTAPDQRTDNPAT